MGSVVFIGRRTRITMSWPAGLEREMPHQSSRREDDAPDGTGAEEQNPRAESDMVQLRGAQCNNDAHACTASSFVVRRGTGSHGSSFSMGVPDVANANARQLGAREPSRSYVDAVAFSRADSSPVVTKRCGPGDAKECV